MSGFLAEAEALPTLAQLVEHQARQSSECVFAIFPELSITYGELYGRAGELAKGLIALGVQPGTPVAIFMPNCLDFLLAHYAVQLAGGVGVLLNARYKQYELRHVIAHCDAQILMTTDVIDEHVNLTDVLCGTYPELRDSSAARSLILAGAPLLKTIILFGKKRLAAALSANELKASGCDVSHATLAQRKLGQDAENTAVIIYTSGTTSAPKGCELSHAGLQRSWSIFSRAVGLAAGEKVWDPMPFFHSGGVGLMTGIMARGATIVSSAYFDPEVIVDLILRHRIEHLYPGFHLIALPVLISSRYDATEFAFVRSMVVIGPLGTLRKVQHLLPPGAAVMNLFGMSEASGLVTLTPPDASEDQRLMTNGKQLPGIEVRIVDPDSERPTPPGVTGEIQFRGGGAFRSYYKDPVATASTILPDGWVRTGDMGNLDRDGWLRYEGRYKEMLRVGGENFAAAEIESFLSAHPVVKYVQVVGKPDERLGEVPVAFIECNDGSVATQADIIDFCVGKIAKFKIPRQVVFVTQWPMSATKIQKFKLREMIPAE
ncbi:MAG TPA: class I adenylate-forming enzyme family protein [Steroidobacteraceae bacterium]|nr:class I adenylate-forming enzyme family protein [Steroidobacteraceae bacterium]